MPPDLYKFLKQDYTFILYHKVLLFIKNNVKYFMRVLQKKIRYVSEF